MIILDAPFVAPEMLVYLRQSKQPVLRNAFSESLDTASQLNLVDTPTACAYLKAQQRLYTTSENALGWIEEQLPNSELARIVAVFKDKARMRELLAPLCPDISYLTLSFEELSSFDPVKLSYPCVLKPSVGFCSLGVSVVNDEIEFMSARARLMEEHKHWQHWYPRSVVGDSRFIIEPYLSGEEFALDAYYDDEGKACILNVLKHEFAGPEDTSDRLYFTNADLIRQYVQCFEAWLNQANQLIQARNIPLHIELRVDRDTIRPIEFNPLRFAGLCGTELAFFAYGFHTYDYYLRNVRPNWDELLENDQGATFTMSLLPAPASARVAQNFDLDRFTGPLEEVVECYHFDPMASGFLAFIFCRISQNCEQQKHYLLTEELGEYLR